jgi:hypothetical protein
VDILKVTIGEFIPSFRIFGLVLVDTQIPFGVFSEAVLAYKVILFFGGRSMLAPRISIIEYYMSCGDKLFGVLEGLLVQLH